jgi:hypothetical protein
MFSCRPRLLAIGLVSVLALGISVQAEPDEASPNRGLTEVDVEPSTASGLPTEVIDETHLTIAVPRGAATAEATSDVPEATTDPAWELIQELPLFQRLAVGDRFGVQFDQSAESLIDHPMADPITTLARQAVDRSPNWLQKQLEDAFTKMSVAQQDQWAGMILDALDPYVDEVAFLIAHISRDDLADGSFFPQLITDSSEFPYEADPLLDYVEVVDYGSAAGGGDYYTTVRYQVDLGGEVSTVEYPRQLYYWYIVHPRGSDELPTYIDPVPCSSGGTPTAPPTGKFWREWLFHGADNKYGGLCDTDWDGNYDNPCPVLKNMLAGVPVLWKHLNNTNGPANGAVGVVNDWVRKSIGKFGDKDGCRPVQPVLVYYHTDGNCGEWADLTMAAGRAAMIPTEVTSTFGNDHVWNEFYDGQWARWVQWEPVNNMINASYSGWWGGGLYATHSYRGDGYGHTGITADHGPSATLTVTVYDATHYPVDGVEVVLGYQDYIPPFLFLSYSSGHTDREGKITFVIGDTRNFYARVSTPWGEYPSSGWALVVSGAVPDTDYFWSPPDAPGSVPRLSVTDLGPPGGTDDYLVEADFAVSEGLVHGEGHRWNRGSPWEDPGILYCKELSGDLDFFVVDDTNWGLFTSDLPFDAHDVSIDDIGHEDSFIVPDTGDYYVAWSNKASMDMAHVIEGSVRLYRNTGAVPPVNALMVDRDVDDASLLDWEDVIGQNVDGYNLYRSTNAADVGADRTEPELDPFLIASPPVSDYRDPALTATGQCFYYSVRTRSSRGGISP